jgi:hypothetical protein
MQPGEFLSAYIDNRTGATALALESSPFALAVRDHIESRGAWRGPVGDLLSSLTTDERRKVDGWPRNAQKASAVLRQFAPCLRGVGIEVAIGERDPSTRRTIYTISKVSAGSAGSAGSSAGDAAGKGDAPIGEVERSSPSDPGASQQAGIGREAVRSAASQSGTWPDPEEPRDPADLADALTGDLYADEERAAIQEEHT